MRRSLFIIFSLLFSSPTLAISIDDERESPPSQPPSPKESEVQKAPAAAGSDSLEYFTKAMEWYLLAAGQGHAGAQYSIGMLYDMGRGVARDPAMAMKYYLLAAAQNHPSAQNNIGLLLAMSEGVRQDSAKARKLFRKTAAQGNAIQWFQKAADQGHEEAKENIERLKGKTKAVRFWISSKR